MQVACHDRRGDVERLFWGLATLIEKNQVVTSKRVTVRPGGSIFPGAGRSRHRRDILIVP